MTPATTDKFQSLMRRERTKGPSPAPAVRAHPTAPQVQAQTANRKMVAGTFMCYNTTIRIVETRNVEPMSNIV